MRVVVKVHRTAETDYRAWQARLRQPPTGNAGIARLHAEELFRRLIDSQGEPPNSEKDESQNPPIYVWRYANDTWIRFIHRDETGRFGSRVRKVVILGIATSRPE